MTDAHRPGGSRRLGRIAALLGPEGVGGLAAAIALGIAIVVVVRPVDGGGPAPSATVLPTGPAASVRTGSPSLVATPAPWAGRATTLIDVEGRLIDERDAMAAGVDPPPARADDLAARLRAVNGQLIFALGVIDGLEDEGLDQDLVDRLRSAHQLALDASLDGLDASLSNVSAYVATTRTVVTALADLEALSAELARASGLSSAGP